MGLRRTSIGLASGFGELRGRAVVRVLAPMAILAATACGGAVRDRPGESADAAPASNPQGSTSSGSGSASTDVGLDATAGVEPLGADARPDSEGLSNLTDASLPPEAAGEPPFDGTGPGPDASTDATTRGPDAAADAGVDATVDATAPSPDASADATGDGSDDASDGAVPCADLNSDTHNCGFCGHDCLGGDCSAGACLPISLANDSVFGDSAAEGLAVDDTNVYWVDNLGQIFSEPKNGGPITTLANDPPGPVSIAVGGGAVYWVSQNGTLRRLVLGDRTPTTLGATAGESVGLALTPSAVYWTTTALSPADPNDGGVLTVPLDGGPATVIAAGQNVPAYIVASPTAVYWVDFNVLTGRRTTVMQAPLTGGAVVSVPLSSDAGFASGVDGIAIDSSYVYFTADNMLEKVPLDGGGPILLATGLDAIGLAVDDSGIYVGLNQEVYRVALDGSSIVTLAQGFTELRGIAVDATAVYFTTPQALWKLAK